MDGNWVTLGATIDNPAGYVKGTVDAARVLDATPDRRVPYALLNAEPPGADHGTQA